MQPIPRNNGRTTGNFVDLLRAFMAFRIDVGGEVAVEEKGITQDTRARLNNNKG